MLSCCLLRSVHSVNLSHFIMRTICTLLPPSSSLSSFVCLWCDIRSIVCKSVRQMVMYNESIKISKNKRKKREWEKREKERILPYFTSESWPRHLTVYLSHTICIIQCDIKLFIFDVRWFLACDLLKNDSDRIHTNITEKKKDTYSQQRV